MLWRLWLYALKTEVESSGRGLQTVLLTVTGKLDFLD